MKIKYILISLVLLVTVSTVFAQSTILGRDSFGLPKPIQEQTEHLSQPGSILITPLFLPKDTVVSDDDWYRAIYYYQAFRLQQGDFLFHYVVTRDGRVITANAKGDDQQFNFNKINSRPIVIAYLAGNNDNDFTTDAKSTLSSLMLTLANKYSISLDKISVKNINMNVSQSGVVIETSLITGRWDPTLKSMITNITPQYNPIKHNYKITVVKVETPVQAVNYGDDVSASLTLRNESDVPIFQGSDAEPIIVKAEGNSSLFYVNEVWLSQTQASLMKEGQAIKPQQESTFQVKLHVPFYFGLQTEKFQLANSLGQVYANSGFEIKLTINHPTKEVVEITKTETGQLNVRVNPWSSAEVTSRVTPGQRFFVLDKTDTGWIKLDLGAEKSGWVVKKYTKVV